MIRFVRLHADGDAVPAGLDQLAARGQLDLVQLDYARPRRALVDEVGQGVLPEVADSFVDAVRGMSKTLFLEPDLRIVASAGWSNAYHAAERVAQTLVDAGCPEAPVSAVRGSNVLPILDHLVAGKLKLQNLETGAPWSSLRATILAADLQLGAGPIATAWAEGGRVIVAGCYDGAAPAIAAAVAAGQWSWKELDRLAGAAAAAHAAVWPRGHGCAWHAMGDGAGWLAHPQIELDADGSFTVDVAQPCNESEARDLVAWLQAGAPRQAAHDHADVRYDAAQASASRTGPTQFRVSGIVGAANPDGWRLDVLYEDGFVAESMLEFLPGAARDLRRQIAEAFRSRFVDAIDEHSYVALQELAPAELAAGEPSWLHLTCRSPQLPPCQDFANALATFATANPRLVRLPAGRPTAYAECGVWPTRIPRDAVDVAVDTRPAKEWQ